MAGCLSAFFTGWDRVPGARPSRGWLALCRPHRLLNYDVVLNVELVMNIHYVNLHTLPIGALLGPWRMLLVLLGTRLASSLHVRGNDPLHMEVLLVVGSILFCVLGTRVIDYSTASVGVLLDILGGMVRSTTHATTPTHRLRRSLVVAL